MTNIVFFLYFSLSCLFIFNIPLIISSFYVLLSILQPTHVWKFDFTKFPFSYYTGLLIVVITSLYYFRNYKIGINILKDRVLLSLFSILILFYLSDHFSDFKSYRAGVGSKIVIDSLTTIVILYLCNSILILTSKNPIKSISFLVLIFILCSMYYIFWANDRYLSGNWSYFRQGRLLGTPSGPYKDGNVLSVLLVIAHSFFMVLIFNSRKLFVICLSLLAVISSWSAIFLFGSRGALIGLMFSIFYSLFLIKRSKNYFNESQDFIYKLKIIKTIIISGFIYALFTQANTVIERSEELVDRDKTENTQPINPRIQSWNVGLKLTLDFPMLGVGPQRFQEASKIFYPGESIHVAHNTFLNFSANTGLITLCFYIYIILLSLKRTKLEERYCISRYSIPILISSRVSLLSFCICAFFLDLIIFEPFYFIILVINTIFIYESEKKPISDK